jgi:RNA-directed DNA polymerase
MSLLEKIASKENLFSAWSLINKNPYSYGIDRKTIQSVRDNIYSEIQLINKELLNKKFKFSPYRAHKLIKKGKKPRLLRIPTVTDRIVQKGILNIIGPKFYSDFYDCSFGYREGRRISDAVFQILKHQSEGYFFVLEADIEKFFDTVDKEKLFEMVMGKLKKSVSLELLLKDSLNAEIGNPEMLSYQEIELLNNQEIGIPQGGILSPLYANIYLTSFDKKMFEAGFKLVRYADDFIVLCKTKEEAQKAHSFCIEILENQLKLRLHPLEYTGAGKTTISDFKRGFKYLGIQFGNDYICPAEASVKKFKNKLEELTNFKQINFLLDNLIKLSGLVYGWGNAYQFCKNSKTEDIFKALDIFVFKRTDAMLKGLKFLPNSQTLSNAQLELLKIPKLLEIYKKYN